MSIRSQITDAMNILAEEPRVVFCGYNVKYGKAGGSLKDVPESQLTEWPLAENLMAGGAIGMALDGHIPVLYFERMDFVLCALDSIVNHLDKLAGLSEGLHKPAVIIRCVVGNKAIPLFTGQTHCQDFTEAMKKLVKFPVVSLWWSRDIVGEYRSALARAREGVSTMLIDFKDQYDA